MKTLHLIAALIFSTLLAATPVGAQTSTPVGIWEDASERILVKIAPCGDMLCGKLVWFKWPNDEQGLPVVDLKNRDSGLRNRALLGLIILHGLHRTEENEWEDGEIYDPNDGEDYHARMSILDDGTLRVRVYELFPIFGETHIWTRVP